MVFARHLRFISHAWKIKKDSNRLFFPILRVALNLHPCTRSRVFMVFGRKTLTAEQCKIAISDTAMKPNSPVLELLYKSKINKLWCDTFSKDRHLSKDNNLLRFTLFMSNFKYILMGAIYILYWLIQVSFWKYLTNIISSIIIHYKNDLRKNN